MGRELQEREVFPNGIITEWGPGREPDHVPPHLRHPSSAKDWRALVTWLNSRAKAEGSYTRFRSVEIEQP